MQYEMALCIQCFSSPLVARAVLNDLMIALSGLINELLIAEFDAYGFSRSELLFICSNNNDKKNWVDVNGSSSRLHGQKPSWV